MSGGLAIFVKTPGLSSLKTRLAAGIGREAAEAWYLLAARAVRDVAASVEGVEVSFAVAEECSNAQSFWRQLHDAAPLNLTVPQGQGSLGQRMAQVYASLLSRHRFAILIGADSPQISSTDLQAACAWLDASEPRLCLGPASDGGFWLFGGNRLLPEQAWLSPQYSAPDTAREFQQAMQGNGAWLELRQLTDVDTEIDLRPVSTQLNAMKTLVPAQSELLHWMQSNLIEWQ